MDIKHRNCAVYTDRFLLISWFSTKWQTYLLYFKLAWEPSAARVTKSYSRFYPHLNDFTGKLNFRNWSRPTQLRIWNQTFLSPEFPNQNLRQFGPEVPELWSDKQTYRQTEIITLYIDTTDWQLNIRLLKCLSVFPHIYQIAFLRCFGFQKTPWLLRSEKNKENLIFKSFIYKKATFWIWQKNYHE